MSGQAAGLPLLRCLLGDILPNRNRFIRHHLGTRRVTLPQSLRCADEFLISSLRLQEPLVPRRRALDQLQQPD